jgi:ubiquinone/menaquinone biosynthesis C-methylase UbiE
MRLTHVQESRNDSCSTVWDREKLRDFFDRFAHTRHHSPSVGYRELVADNFKFLVEPGRRVLEIGCGTGDLLASLSPSYGVGVDLSDEMIRFAKSRHPQASLRFERQEAETLELDDEPFDYIILSDTLTFLDDILAVLRRIRPLCHPRTRIITNTFSRLWSPILRSLELAGLRHPQPMLNWVTREDVCNLLELAGFEVVTTDSRILFPARVPVLSTLFNRWVAPTPGFRWMCLTNWVVARQPSSAVRPLSVSVVCPCRNEAGNIPEIVRRFPQFPGPAELIFVEGHSQDDTWQRCQQAQADNPHLNIRIARQGGKGKGDAVRLGFDMAQNDALMILDADMTVAPEDLPGFLETLAGGQAEFVNGSRLVYPMQDEAMRFLNLVANKFFAAAFSWLLGQSIKDTLCGTKVLLREDYRRLVKQRSYFGDFDPFGDFDLIFGAAKLGLKLRDYPIRYRSRTYGTTQISRFRHGWMLLKMYAFALLKLKWR